jgi:hypothetical protein
MRLEHIEVDESFVKSADRLVEFDADDLPSPGVGFERFFELLNQEQPQAVTQEVFDDEVLKTYGRKP